MCYSTDCLSLVPGPELVEYFRAQIRKDPDMASAVAAIRTLLEFLKRDKGKFPPCTIILTPVIHVAPLVFMDQLHTGLSPFRHALPAPSGETILGLRESLMWATDCLTGVDSSVAVSSGGELFLRFISLTYLEHQVCYLPGTKSCVRTNYWSTSKLKQHSMF